MTLKTLQRSELGHGAQGHWAGRAGGELLVLIHGVGMSADAWAPQIEALGEHYRLLLLDMPGHGQSQALPISDAQLPDYVQWVASVIADLGAGAVSVAGHSMGAFIAAGLAVTRPDLISRVALLNGVHQRSEAAREAVIARAAQIHAGEREVEAPLSRWFSEAESERAAKDLCRHLLQNVSIEGYAAAYGAFARGDQYYATQLDKIACPALMLTGDGDPNSTPEMARDMAAATARGRACVVAGHKHMVNLTAPEAVNRALLEWMQEEPTT